MIHPGFKLRFIQGGSPPKKGTAGRLSPSSGPFFRVFRIFASILYIQVSHFLGVRLDKALARWDSRAHEHIEGAIGFGGIIDGD